MRFVLVVVGLLVVPHAALTQEHGARHHDHLAPRVSQAPQETGQSAFAAIQEIVLILDEDPSTDWDRVDLEALRQHLRDMEEVTLYADADQRQVDGGIVIEVTGTARTREALGRMVVAHAAELDRLEGWSAAGKVVPGGAELSVTSSDPNQVRRIRGLGFIGLMATGAHHQEHHLAIARGEAAHAHP